MHLHAIGSPEGVTLLEFEAREQEDQQPKKQQEVQGEGKDPEELPECPNHWPSAFLKGKLWSILSLPCFYKYQLKSLCLMH
jgi:hypothetical protein